MGDIGLHEEWLGCGLLVEWTGHSDYPSEALTIGLVELISRHQAEGGDPEAVNALHEKQRGVLAGLLPFETALELYSQAYLLCVKARKEVNKDEIGGLLNLLPPVIRHVSGLPQPKKYSKQKAHAWAEHLSKLLTLAYLGLEAHKEGYPPEEPAEELEVEDSDEDIDMTALAGFELWAVQPRQNAALIDTDVVEKWVDVV